MKKIFFFLSQPYDAYNQKRFSFEFLRRKGFDPIYVDLTTFFLNRNHRNKGYIKKVKVIKIGSYKDFFLFLNKYKKKFFFIDLVTYDSFFYNIFQKILSKRGCLKIHISTNFISLPQLLTPKEKLLIYLKKLKLLELILSLVRFIFRKIINSIKVNPNFFFVSCKAELKKFSRKNNIFASCGLDYNLYLDTKNMPLANISKQIVYLDQNFLYHKDLSITKDRSINNKFYINYYKKLKIFLEKIQINENCKIVICLHPRSEKNSIKYLKKLFNFKNIKFSWNTSLEIKKSRFVIFNYSNSHQLAVLYNKPMLIVHNFSNKYFDFYTKKKIITKISKELQIPILNLNNNINNYKLKYKINKSKYKKYIFNYLSLIYPRKKNSWSILTEVLNKNNL